MSARAPRRRCAARALLTTALAAAAALLASCSGSTAGLIPAANAGPLRGDFEAVARAAENGDGKCSETESALSRTELDFAALPATVSGELRSTLRQGIDNLKHRALELCSEPLAQATNTTPAPTQTTTTKTTTTKTPTTSTPTTSTPAPPVSTTPQTGNPGGGTPAEEPKETGNGNGGGEEHPGNGHDGEEHGGGGGNGDGQEGGR